MSMNKYMHPRNIYRNPPNFKKLAMEYPEFRENVQQDITGKITLDFKDLKALRSLSRVLLQKDFDLNIEMPADKLIPTIPLRLNYLLWIEDLLSIQNTNTKNILGIDIGTGASCVYPLMAARKCNWHMIGTEIDKESLECAQRNIYMNSLDEFVEVYEVSGDSLLTELLSNDNRTFHFCMCNPPFFSSKQELHPFFRSRNSRRPHPKNAFCASLDEVVVTGGEKDFISKLIRESSVLKDKIIIFTTMVGNKTSLAPLKSLLRENEVCSFKQTEFCQGHTTRWGLAWTYQNIDLRTVPTLLRESKSKQKPLIYVIPNLNKNNYTIECVTKSLKEIFNQLELEVEECPKNKGIPVFEVMARKNTWSNQRRKRREKLKRNEKDSDVDTSLESEHQVSANSSDSVERTSNQDNFEFHATSEKLADMNIASPTPKREHEDDEYYNCKRFKNNIANKNNDYIARFFVSVGKQKSEIVLELFSVDGETNRDTIHQILQYIKNNFR